MKLHNPTDVVLGQTFRGVRVEIQPGEDSPSLNKIDAMNFRRVFPMLTVVPGTEDEDLDEVTVVDESGNASVPVLEEDDDEMIEADPDYNKPDYFEEAPKVLVKKNAPKSKVKFRGKK